MPKDKTQSHISPLAIIVICILIVGLIIGVVLSNKKQTLNSQAATVNAYLTLNPVPSTKTSYLQNETLTLNLGLSNPTNQPVLGIDYVVDFNTSQLTLTDIQPNTSAGLPTFAPLTNNTFNKSAVISAANSSGQIRFGAVAFNLSTQQVTSAANFSISNLATAIFQVKSNAPNGASQIKINYTQNGTTDSNIVDNSNPPQDLLAGAQTLNLTIGAASTTVPTAVPTPAASQGDANGDGKVNGVDYAIWLANYGTTNITGGPSKGDFNSDKNVNGVDYSIWLFYYKP